MDQAEARAEEAFKSGREWERTHEHCADDYNLVREERDNLKAKLAEYERGVNYSDNEAAKTISTLEAKLSDAEKRIAEMARIIESDKKVIEKYAGPDCGPDPIFERKARLTPDGHS